MAPLKCQQYWLKALDGEADHVRVLSFHFSKAFDTVSYRLSERSSKLPSSTPKLSIINFLNDRKQRVLVDGFITNYLFKHQ